METDKDFIPSQLIDGIDPLLTNRQKLYVQQIMNTFNSKNTDLNSILTSLNSIEAEVKFNCSSDELPVLLSAISVAKHSSQYWHDNYSKWRNEFGDFNSQMKTQTQEVNWWAVGGADVAAAVSVGVATSTALVVPFIGWATWGIITGGGALITSGFTAILYATS